MMLNLFETVSDGFGFVQILLDPEDEPEKIFESLNARGKRLLQFDLLRIIYFYVRIRIETAYIESTGIILKRRIGTPKKSPVHHLKCSFSISSWQN